MEEFFEEFDGYIKSLGSLVVAESVPKLVLKVYVNSPWNGFTEAGFENVLMERLSLLEEPEMREVVFQWEEHIWPPSDS